MWNKQHFLIGVTGGIAAYKTVDLVSRLKKKGADVTVIMTRNAKEFVSPLTFQTISRNRVYTELFEEDWDVRHISLAKRGNVLAVVPATANFINKAAHGLADDLLSTVFLAFKGKRILVPSMNVNMYDNPITQKSLNKLKEMGCYIVEPEEGFLACGDVGKGRLPEPEIIIEELEYIISKKDLSGKKILVTAGPTIEPIDPVRYISNRSSGKMGYAIARAARNRGADVILISGPTHITPPCRIKLIRVETAQQMFERVVEHFHEADIVIKAAAVCDFKPKSPRGNKIKKNEMDFNLVLGQNKDILYELGKMKQKQILVGFAAETTELFKNARQKLVKKNLNMIVANDVSRTDAGFASDYNKINIIYNTGEIEDLERDTKENLANLILDRVVEHYC